VTINRVRRTSHFTTIPNATLRDARLSWRARGILAYALSHTDDFRLTSADLTAAGAEGRDAVRKALTELEETGYRRQVKVQDDAGKWSTIIEWHDTTEPMPENPTVGISGPEPGKPTPGIPYIGEPGDIQKNTQKNTTPPVSPSGRKTRIPEGFQPDDALMEWTRENTPGIDARVEWEKFIDHHTAKGSTFADWRAAWRTWARKAQQWSEERRPARTSGADREEGWT